ncbi:MAG: hypothetical protein QM736_10715 [Vicinamibacterales bacterium]
MLFDSSRPRARAVVLFALGLALATSLTFWLGLRATREWQRSTRQAAETRANEVAALLTVALERDMKGGQVSVLLTFNEPLANAPPYELADRFARGFARFPYLDSFYVWNDHGGDDGSTYIFNRAESHARVGYRRSSCRSVSCHLRRKDPAALRSTSCCARPGSRGPTPATRVRGGRDRRTPLSDDLASDLRRRRTKTRLKSASFLVNLDWVQQHYFGDFLRAIQRIIGDPSLSSRSRQRRGRHHRICRSAAVEPASSSTCHVRHSRFAEQALFEYPTSFA